MAQVISTIWEGLEDAEVCEIVKGCEIVNAGIDQNGAIVFALKEPDGKGGGYKMLKFYPKEIGGERVVYDPNPIVKSDNIIPFPVRNANKEEKK